jgi:hypothetical protein
MSLQNSFYAHLDQANRASGSRVGCELLLPLPQLVSFRRALGGGCGGMKIVPCDRIGMRGNMSARMAGLGEERVFVGVEGYLDIPLTRLPRKERVAAIPSSL